MRYTTMGPVCLDCEHIHKSLRAAWKCLRDHQRGCRSQGGYSDRQIVPVADKKDAIDLYNLMIRDSFAWGAEVSRRVEETGIDEELWQLEMEEANAK